MLRRLQSLALQKQLSNALAEEGKAVRFSRRDFASSKQDGLSQSTSSAPGPGVALGGNLRRVAVAIHGSSEADPLTKPDEASRVCVDSIKQFQRLQVELQQLSEKRVKGSPPKGKNSWSKLDLPIIQEILTRLDIAVPTQIKKDRKELLNKAAEAIYADIELVANEARETMKRCTSYWRFASKKTYNAMIRNNQLVNWETGEKLSEDSSSGEED